MKITSIEPRPDKRVLFKLSSYKTVPKASGCYVLTTFGDEVLYIGLALNLNTRFNQHLENHEKINVTAEGKAVWFYYFLYDSKNLQKLERTWLNQFVNFNGRLPILNKINSPVG